MFSIYYAIWIFAFLFGCYKLCTLIFEYVWKPVRLFWVDVVGVYGVILHFFPMIALTIIGLVIGFLMNSLAGGFIIVGFILYGVYANFKWTDKQFGKIEKHVGYAK